MVFVYSYVIILFYTLSDTYFKLFYMCIILDCTYDPHQLKIQALLPPMVLYAAYCTAKELLLMLCVTFLHYND